jgi:hypothetical protein
MLTTRARSLFPSWVDLATIPASLRALAVYAAQNPGLDFRDYGHVPSYRADARRITKDLQRCRDAMHSCCGRGITDAQVAEAARHTFAGRLALELRADGSVRVDYCVGQYFGTEYRAAVAAVLEQVAREAYRRTQEAA